MYLVDTNIFLEILLEQDRSEECEKLLNLVDEAEAVFYVSSFTLHSIEVIMTREGKTEELQDFLDDIASLQLKRLDTTTQEEKEAAASMEDHGLDFDDAVQHQACESHGLDIISYDDHFDDTTVTRLEPATVIDDMSEDAD